MKIAIILLCVMLLLAAGCKPGDCLPCDLMGMGNDNYENTPDAGKADTLQLPKSPQPQKPARK